MVRNSWGTAYGEKGYIRIAREKLVTCGIDQTPLDGQACSGQNQPTKVCGQCGILFDGSYPLNARVVDWKNGEKNQSQKDNNICDFIHLWIKFHSK